MLNPFILNLVLIIGLKEQQFVYKMKCFNDRMCEACLKWAFMQGSHTQNISPILLATLPYMVWGQMEKDLDPGGTHSG